MMDKEWRGILSRYGQDVQVFSPEEEHGNRVRAFLQPLLEREKEQTVPSPLGLRREDRLLYLGPPDVPLASRESRVIWLGRRYEVQNAHPIAGAGTVHHWWAVLRPVDQEAE